MNLTVAYRDRSAIVSRGGGLAVVLAPDLRRGRVSFDAALRQPLRFRDAIAAFHDVVIGDRRGADHLGLQGSRAAGPASPDRDFRERRRRYWAARRQFADDLMAHDPGLWRLRMPTDPVVTVAPDVLSFEGFRADESSYACLTVDRGAFADECDVSIGTTSVDYSWKLAGGFQVLRDYRPTRFLVDAGGAGDGHLEEDVDVPASWLRGFLRLQAAMSLPMRRVALGREGLYNVLATLERHGASRGPRAVRFELAPGHPAAVVLEPWGRRVVLHDRPYDGPKAETIRVWGRDRLRALARTLPMLDEAEVYLLGTGLPSFWSTRMGEVRLLLGLTGRTAADRAVGSGPSRLDPPTEPGRYLASRVAASFRASPGQSLAEVAARSGGPEPEVLAALHQLAGLGQVAHDLHAGLYRWRPWTPGAITADRLGPEGAEVVAAREIARTQSVRVDRDEARPDGSRALEGQILERPASMLLDADGRPVRGHCTCSHHRAGRLRAGPCRHLLALLEKAAARPGPSDLGAWAASFGG